MSAFYGAVGNGTIDDGPAIRAAIAAMPGSLGSTAQGATLYFPPGKTFLINTTDAHPANRDSYPCGVTLDKPITVIAYGATFIFGTRIGAHPAICTNDQANGATGLTTQSSNAATGYALSGAPIPDGSMSVTTTTAADAGNFAAGDWAWIKGNPATKVGDQALMQVVSANASTGVITFTTPTPKPFVDYGGTSGGSGPLPTSAGGRHGVYIYNISNQLVHNIYWFGGTFKDAPPITTSSAVWDIAWTQNAYFKDMTFGHYPDSVMEYQIGNGGNADITFDHISYYTNGDGALDVEYDSSRISFINSEARCDTGPSPEVSFFQQSINVGEGSDHVEFDHDTVYAGCRSSLGIVQIGNVGQEDFSITNSRIYGTNPSTNEGIALNGCGDVANWGQMKTCTGTFANNWVQVAANTGFADGVGFTSMNIANNHIEALDSGASGAGAGCIVGHSPEQVIGNYCYGVAGLYKQYDIGFLNNGTLIEGNTIVGFGSGTNGYGVFVNDPGAMAAAPDAMIFGNNIHTVRGTRFCLSFLNAAHNPNIFIEPTAGASNPPGFNECASP